MNDARDPIDMVIALCVVVTIALLAGLASVILA